MDFAERRARFRALHAAGCFVIPNPWDVGSAIMLEQLGFKALASTSAGFAFTRGLVDNAITLDMALAHLRELAHATNLPLNADFEGAFAVAPADVARNVRLCADTGVSGLSVEDSTGDRAQPLFDFTLAVERVAAAAEALKGTGVLLTARCEAHLVGYPDAQAEVLKRLPAFVAAGADVLYAPGLKTKSDIAAVVAAAGGRPVNLLIGSDIGISVADAAALGVRRVSVGASFARAAWGGFLRAAREVAEAGTFTALAEAEPGAVLHRAFKGRKP